MTIEHDTTRIVRSWLRTDEHESAERVLDLVLGALDSTPQRRSLRQAWTTYLRNGTFRFASATLVITVAAALGLALYVSRPAVGPVASPSPSPSPAPSPSPGSSPAGGSTGIVAYTGVAATCDLASSGGCPHRIWVANADGTDAHELLPGIAGAQDVIGWSPDGSQLLYMEPHEGGQPDVFRTDAAGSPPQLVCARDAASCPYLDSVFSPDGTRLAYGLNNIVEGTSTVAIFELATGQVTELESTRVPSTVTQCETADIAGRNRASGWSRDGSQLLFSRGIAGSLPFGNCREAVTFVIGADGIDLRQLTPTDMWATAGTWSPDGTRIAFAGDERRPSYDLWATDLYTMQADGSDRRRLTTDGGAGAPNWTRDGRIVYLHVLAGGTFDEVRLTNWDGTGETKLQYERLTDLTAAGCTVCPYASAVQPDASVPGVGLAFWQPMPERQP